MFLADRLMASGFSPRELCKAPGFELPAGLRKFDPDQPRDEQGRWTVGEGAAPQAVTEGRSISPGGPRNGDEIEDELDAERHALGEETPEEDQRHGRPIDPLGPTSVPFGGTRPTPTLLNQGQQDKPIESTNNFDSKRSVLTDPDPQGLLDRFAGTGTPVNNIPRGQPGFRERVNFGKIIGNFVDQSTGRSYPTTNGVIHYDKKSAHIVPSNP